MGFAERAGSVERWRDRDWIGLPFCEPLARGECEGRQGGDSAVEIRMLYSSRGYSMLDSILDSPHVRREEHIGRKIESMVAEAKAKMAKGDKKGRLRFRCPIGPELHSKLPHRSAFCHEAKEVVRS